MSADAIAAAIVTGDADDDLRLIWAAVRARYDVLNMQAKNAFSVGDHVRFTDEATNFGGQTGVIARKLPKNIVVELDDGTGDVRTSPALLESYEPDGPSVEGLKDLLP